MKYQKRKRLHKKDAEGIQDKKLKIFLENNRLRKRFFCPKSPLFVKTGIQTGTPSPPDPAETVFGIFGKLCAVS